MIGSKYLTYLFSGSAAFVTRGFRITLHIPWLLMLLDSTEKLLTVTETFAAKVELFNKAPAKPFPEVTSVKRVFIFSEEASKLRRVEAT